MLITAWELEILGACADGLRRFREHVADDEQIDARKLVGVLPDSDLIWFIRVKCPEWVYCEMLADLREAGTDAAQVDKIITKALTVEQ